MEGITIRQARTDELPFLASHLGPTVELTLGRVWVAEQDGALVGVAPLRLCWQIEPLLLLPNKLPKVGRSRAALMLYLAVENWIGSSANRYGPRWLFAVTRSPAVKSWSKRLGWFRIHIGAAMFLKHLPPTF